MSNRKSSACIELLYLSRWILTLFTALFGRTSLYVRLVKKNVLDKENFPLNANVSHSKKNTDIACVQSFDVWKTQKNFKTFRTFIQRSYLMAAWVKAKSKQTIRSFIFGGGAETKQTLFDFRFYCVPDHMTITLQSWDRTPTSQAAFRNKVDTESANSGLLTNLPQKISSINYLFQQHVVIRLVVTNKFTVRLKWFYAKLIYFGKLPRISDLPSDFRYQCFSVEPRWRTEAEFWQQWRANTVCFWLKWVVPAIY